ncbi:hypothetical protein QMZ65_03045 [Pantoea sp. EABMAA-21]|uniref:hypothetical protein n=1 Tax=Pantoea sp. EABMAA-21 TaxID=3043302 RepID=UPI0024B56AF2|nr:hypothetical protein [Pantoea sp. EABMAA-21]MDI9276181.1 hypothetical protein [Pantoea sp. EABMAA-21]
MMVSVVKHWKISAYENVSTLVSVGYQKEPNPEILNGFLVLSDEEGLRRTYLSLEKLSAFVIETIKEE